MSMTGEGAPLNPSFRCERDAHARPATRISLQSHSSPSLPQFPHKSRTPPHSLLHLPHRLWPPSHENSLRSLTLFEPPLIRWRSFFVTLLENTCGLFCASFKRSLAVECNWSFRNLTVGSPRGEVAGSLGSDR